VVRAGAVPGTNTTTIAAAAVAAVGVTEQEGATVGLVGRFDRWISTKLPLSPQWRRRGKWALSQILLVAVNFGQYELVSVLLLHTNKNYSG
jgi:hypothetical protein